MQRSPRGKQNPLAGGSVNRRYVYDKAGNLIQSADQRSGVLHYVYDKIGRIQEARNSQTGRSETFAFDPAHNILDIPTSTPSPVGEGWGEGKTTAPISDDPKTQGRLKSPANPNPVSGNRLKSYNGIEYTYDALGNLIYRQLPNGENQYYQYDLENQLVRAEIKKPAGNTEIWTYAYDPFGRRLSKERQDKLAWTSTEPKRTHFVWDGTRLLQEYTYKGSYTYIYTDQDSYEPLAQVFHNNQDEGQYLAYFHNDQIGIPKEMTDIHGNLLWYGEYTAWGRLKKDERVYKDAHQPFRLQNQYFDEETGLHYNFFRYYEPDTGRFINQDPIRLIGGDNLYQFADNIQKWNDPLGLWRRNAYLGRTPSKVSATGRAVMKRMLRDKLITGITEKQIDALTRTSQIPKDAKFKDVDGKEYSLRGAHMGHNPEDAVDYWNRCGRYHGAKSKPVRDWMLNPDNYRLEYGPGNCSRGGKSKSRYKKPRKPRNGKVPKGC